MVLVTFLPKQYYWKRAISADLAALVIMPLIVAALTVASPVTEKRKGWGTVKMAISTWHGHLLRQPTSPLDTT